MFFTDSHLNLGAGSQLVEMVFVFYLIEGD